MSSVTTEPVKIKSGPALEVARASFTRVTLDQCMKYTIYETQYPVLWVIGRFPGPKYVGPQAERYRGGHSVDHSLDYCSGYSIYSTSCPQGVKMAEINAQAWAVMKTRHIPLYGRLITQTELGGKLLTPFASIVNWALDTKWSHKLIEVVIGVHIETSTSKAQFHSFMHWWKHHTLQITEARGTPMFFYGRAGRYFEVSTSIATVRALEHLGYRILVPKQRCCGLASQSNGLFDIASKLVLRLCRNLRAVGDNLTIISYPGSCAGMLRHEAHEIMSVNAAELHSVDSRAVGTNELLVELLDEGELPVEELHLMGLGVIYRQLCQVKPQGIGKPTIRLLGAVPSVRVAESGEPCCGIGGIYGLKKERFRVA